MRRLIQEKWLQWTYDAMKVEVICLLILTFIHGKNLWYISDIYPVALFLFVLPLGVVAFFDYVLGVKYYNDHILLLVNIACLAVIGNYILKNYYEHPSRYKTGGYGLLGDSTFYCGHSAFDKKADTKYEIDSMKYIETTTKDSMDSRFRVLPEYTFHGVVISTNTYSKSLNNAYVIYGFYSGQVKGKLYISRWSMNDFKGLCFMSRDSFRMSDTLSNKGLAVLVRTGFY